VVTDPARQTELVKLKSEIISLAERVLAVDVRAYESMAPERIAGELQPIVSELLASANHLVTDVLAAYEVESIANAWDPEPADPADLASPYVPFEKAIDAAIDAQTASSLKAVGDIAFLASLELRQRAERLERVTACKSTVSIIGECDSALRRIRKVLTSIDVALARAGLVDQTLDFASELEESLRVRRACAKLRRRVRAGGEVTRENLCSQLRRAGTAIAMLVGWEVYPSLRVADRLQLRDLQRRILEWLRQDQDALAGMRLWQDLVGFVGMLSQVNRRQELMDHDRRTACAACAAVVACASDELPAPTLVLLDALEGLDDEVDAVLGSARRTAREAWLPILERVVRGLGTGAAS
jgi:hypothetical protein